MSDQTFRWIVAIASIIVAVSFLGMAVAMAVVGRIAAKLQQRFSSVTTQAMPIIGTVRKMVQDNAPVVSNIAQKAGAVAANVKDISDVARDQAHRWAEVGRDMADRTKVQVARVDAVVDDTVDKVHHAGDNVKAAVLKPVTEVSAVAAGVKAAFTTFAHGRRPAVDHVTQDEEMFI